MYVCMIFVNLNIMLFQLNGILLSQKKKKKLRTNQDKNQKPDDKLVKLIKNLEINLCFQKKPVDILT